MNAPPPIESLTANSSQAWSGLCTDQSQIAHRAKLRRLLDIASPYKMATDQIELYEELNNLLQSGVHDRFVLYCPLFIIPSITWYRQHTTIDTFLELYLAAWERLLEVRDPKADFTDGDVDGELQMVNDTLNRAFRGTGVQIAAALAYEANQIKAMLENARLPILCGLPTRELLLKKLNVSVPATYPRLETNVTKFALGIMQAERIPSGNDELQYFGTLYMLGANIPWGELDRVTKNGAAAKRPAGIGARRGDRFLDLKDVDSR